MNRIRVPISQELILEALHLNTDMNAIDIEIVDVKMGEYGIVEFTLSSLAFPKNIEGVAPPICTPTLRYESTTVVDWGLAKDGV